METNEKRVNEILKEASRRLLPKHKGKIVAIDTESGDYAVGDTAAKAYREALKKHPNKQFIFKRLGVKHTYFVGAF